MRVIWTDRAAARLSLINETIAEHNPSAAARVVAQIVDRVRGLARFPSKARSGRLRRTRELVIVGTPYVVIYRVRREHIDVLTVLHGAQKWPPGRKRNQDQ